MASGPTLPPQAYTREILTAAFNWLQSQPESVRKLATTPDALVGLYMRAQRYGHSSLEADAPVSSQSFMSDLKNLAEGLKQFEGPGALGPQSVSQANQSHGVTTQQNLSNGTGAYANSQASGRSSTNANGVNTRPQQYSYQQTQAPQGFHTPATQPQNAPATHSFYAPAAQPSHTPSPQSFHASPVQSFHAPTAQSSNGPLAQPSHAPEPLPFSEPYFEDSSAAGLNPRAQQMIQEVKQRLNLSSDSEAINMMVALAYKNLKDLLA